MASCLRYALCRTSTFLSRKTIITTAAALSLAPRLLAGSREFCKTPILQSDEVEKAKEAAKTKGEPTIFDKILSKEIPADIIYEDDKAIAFRDVNPVAPKHALVIPRKQLNQLNDMAEDDIPLIGHLMFVAKKVAQQEGLADNGYRIVINNGVDAAQSVYHLHIHVIGGRQMSWPPG
ncbi:uncharacterized HIT-like protein slr1234 [Nematostella vectensis]|uniref:uncharacterized HIT-like protein slr1234 n=1 Tax=Nematostella vectensis TaxID=45351 RepID=UPI00207714E6|nr:uncharacterized HIT-like protein slr1234 [Nematostella vectensis]